MNRKYIGIIVAVLAVILGGAYAFSERSGTEEAKERVSQKMASQEGETINVMVSVLPQVEFVQRIGGEEVSVSEMIPPGFSPATYNPSPEQLQKLQDADMYFRIGHIPFEKAQMARLENINPDMDVVDTSAGVPLLAMTAHHHHDDEEEHEHEDGHEDEHEHEGEEVHEHEGEEMHEDEEAAGDDPHIWLSPELVKIQAKNILDGLVAYRPESEAYFTENYEQFIADLDELDARLEETFAPIAGQTILVFHPAFGYLADAYGFEQEAIEVEGKDPTPAQLRDIIDRAEEDGARVIFVQKQFSTKSAESVAQEIGGAVVQIDPLAKDYFTNLESLAMTITQAIQ